MLDRPFLFVCFVSCKFFLGHFSFFSFAGWVLKWGLRWAAPACGHSKGLYSQISFLLNIYTHERCVCICAPAAFDLLLQHEPDCLPSCIQVFEFDLDFHCFCSCNTTTRQLHWNEHFAFWLVPVLLLLLLFSACRLRQISSKLFSYSSLCLSSALNCSAACQKMLALSISLTECAFPHLSNHPLLNVSSTECLIWTLIQNSSPYRDSKQNSISGLWHCTKVWSICADKVTLAETRDAATLFIVPALFLSVW